MMIHSPEDQPEPPLLATAVTATAVPEDLAALKKPAAISLEDDLRARAWRAGKVQYHSLMLGMAFFMLAAAALLHVPNDQQVSIPGINFTLPELCFWRLTFDIECAGCGLTRCFISMAHGHWQRAWHFHPAGMLLFVAVAFQLPYRLIQLRRIHQGRPEVRSRVLMICGWSIAVALLLQWIWRLIA